MRAFISCIALFCLSFMNGQELSCKVFVDTQQIGQTNKQVFASLEQKLSELINTTSWAGVKMQPYQRISCNFTLAVSQHVDNKFVASLQVQAARPVYGSNYQSTLLNHRESVSFTFEEHAPLVYNPNEYTSNLVSIVAYYAYIIMGIDADTFAPQAGKPYFEKALQTAFLAQNAPDSAWKDNGDNNRWRLIADLLSTSYEPWHLALYNYHRKGLDLMHNNLFEGKKGIVEAIKLLASVSQTGLVMFPMQVFFNAKSTEITDVFSQGATPNINITKEQLLKIAPAEASLWHKLK